MSRADLHCHSSASEVSKLGVQRTLGLPECATPPEELHAPAERRGMDLVTITDRDRGFRASSHELGGPAGGHGHALAGGVAMLAGSRAVPDRLARGGLAAVEERTWEAGLARLAAGWERALAVSTSPRPAAAAPPA